MQKIYPQHSKAQGPEEQKKKQKEEERKAKEKRANAFIGMKCSGTPLYLKEWRRKHPSYHDYLLYVYCNHY